MKNPPYPSNSKNKPKYESSTIQILCIHHQNKTLGVMEQMDILNYIAENTKYPRNTHNNCTPTPPNTQVNWIKKISSLQNRPSTTHNHFYNPPPVPTYQHDHFQKFNPVHSYYMDGSFKPPMEESLGNWI